MAPRSRSGSTARKKNVVRVDMSGVEGRREVLDAGWYHVRVSATSLEDGDQAQYIKWEFTTVEGNRKLYLNTSLAPQSLWNLRGLLDVIEYEVPDGPMDIELEDLVDRELMVYVDDDEYQGKRRNRVTDFKSYNEGDGGGGTSEYTEEAIEAMDEAELREVAEAEGIELPKTKVLSKLRRAVLDGLGDKIVEQVEDSNPTEIDGYFEEDVEGMDEAALDEVVELHGLEVKKSNRLSVYRSAVLEALNEADLIKKSSSEDQELYAEDDIENMDAEGLDALVEKHSLDVPKTKRLSTYRASVIDALREAELLLADGEQSAEGYTYDQLEAMGPDELQELIKEHDLDIKSGMKGAKLKAHVIAELEAKELIHEGSEQ